MSESVFKLKKVINSLPTVTRYILIASFAAILIACAYYIYKIYIAPQSDRSLLEGYATGMDMRNEHPNGEMVTLYFFGVEWCPHCKHAKPEWDAFVKENEGKTFNGKKVNFVSVDCDKESSLADKYDVSGYPTVKLDTGSDVIEFKSKPEKDTLNQFLHSSL
jgi:thiol-disulfide isomerase/thioredoxin